MRSLRRRSAPLGLSISCLAEGKTAEVRELADEMVTVFHNLDEAREAMAALLLFQEAACRLLQNSPTFGDMN